MKFKIIKPAGVLSRVIDYYWMVEDRENRSVYSEFVYPQGYLQMMFYYGERFYQLSEFEDNTLLPHAYVCGYKNTAVHLSTHSAIGVLGVVFHPAAARQVLGFALQEIRGITLSLSDWLGAAGIDLEERICLARDDHERIALLESFLLGRLSAPAYDQQRVEGAMEVMLRMEGKASLGELAGIACLSERQFERCFAGYVGTSPAHYQRILRLNRAIALAGKRKFSSLAALAVDAGYYDQSHFINDFRTMTGMTPSAFLAFQCQKTDQSGDIY